MPATSPMTMPCHGATNPDAGVMVPSPATAPEIMPSTDGLGRTDHSLAPQATPPTQAARSVAMLPITARDFTATANPQLKPNQPPHSKPVPTTASDRSN